MFHKGYEEVFVPAPPKLQDNSGDDEQLVQIADLDEFAQTVFRGTKCLNRLQSAVFRTAYHSNENMLVCAPTGAGKTNVAMLTVLREIMSHVEDGVLSRDDFKIVYVAPMKALAQEVVEKFSQRLSPLGMVVRELTGDMQLTKNEIAQTQIIVTTPEKWDVVTRKSGDGSLMQLVKLLIIDEVHLLHEDRGAVIESVVARTLRMVESSQSMIRIVGLSATLPNYHDVAVFLRVNPDSGLFFFDNRYRPVPLDQTYIGVTEPNIILRKAVMNEVCFKKVLASVQQGHQVMVFVHSRKDTVMTALYLREQFREAGRLDLLLPDEHKDYEKAKFSVSKSRNNELRELFMDGLSFHNAGMLRSDRSFVEQVFRSSISHFQMSLSLSCF
jgi:activating signal cointegrator complex subunit 3